MRSNATLNMALLDDVRPRARARGRAGGDGRRRHGAVHRRRAFAVAAALLADLHPHVEEAAGETRCARGCEPAGTHQRGACAARRSWSRRRSRSCSSSPRRRSRWPSRRALARRRQRIRGAVGRLGSWGGSRQHRLRPRRRALAAGDHQRRDARGRPRLPGLQRWRPRWQWRARRRSSGGVGNGVQWAPLVSARCSGSRPQLRGG